MPRWGPRFASAIDSGSAAAIDQRSAPVTDSSSATDSASSGARAATAAAVAVIVLGCLVIAHAARGLTFSGDDWGFMTDRRGFSAGVFLRPHNEHLSALPIAAYKLLLAVFGATSYVPFMALLLVTHGIVCLLVYLIARRYVGPWVALAPTAILAVLGPAWQDLLWAFQVGYLGSVASGLGMVLCLERRDRRGDRGAAVLLCVSLLCSSIGLAMVVLGLLLVVLQAPRKWRRLWVIGAPVVLYLIWYAFYGVSTIQTHNIVHIPKYVAQALFAAVSSVTGLAQTPAHVSPFLVSTAIGRYMALLVIVLAAWHLARGGGFPPLFWASSGAALALWVAECLEYTMPARSAQQSRYPPELSCWLWSWRRSARPISRCSTSARSPGPRTAPTCTRRQGRWRSRAIWCRPPSAPRTGSRFPRSAITTCRSRPARTCRPSTPSGLRPIVRAESSADPRTSARRPTTSSPEPNS
jgi:hypothetical protein